MTLTELKIGESAKILSSGWSDGMLVQLTDIGYVIFDLEQCRQFLIHWRDDDIENTQVKPFYKIGYI